MIYLENILLNNFNLILTILVVLAYLIGLLINSELKTKNIPIVTLVISSILINDLNNYSMLLSTLSIVEGIYLIRKGGRAPGYISLGFGFLFVLSNISILNQYHQLLLFVLISTKILLLSYEFQLKNLQISTGTAVIIFSLITNHMVPGDQYYGLCITTGLLILLSSLRYFLDINLKNPSLILLSFILISSFSGKTFTSSLTIYAIVSFILILKIKNLAKITSLTIFIIPFIDSSIFSISLSDFIHHQEVIYSNYLSWTLVVLLTCLTIIYTSKLVNNVSKKISFLNLSLIFLLIFISIVPSTTRGLTLNSTFPLFTLIPLIILLSIYLKRFRGPNLKTLNEFIKHFFSRFYNKKLELYKKLYIYISSIINKNTRSLSHKIFFVYSSSINMFHKLKKVLLLTKNIIKLNTSNTFEFVRTRVGIEELGGVVFALLLIIIFLLGR
jgi:hypothetical protein